MPARGWRGARGTASPRARGARPRGRARGRRCAPTRKPACAGCGGSSSSASAPCLADDMGLGKTMQVIALLLLQRRRAAGRRAASLLVVPASLARQLAERGRALRSRPAPARRASLGRRLPRATGRLAPPRTSPGTIGNHQLRVRLPAAVGRGARLGAAGPRRGAGDQEPRREADAGGQGAACRSPGGPDRHAGREPPRRSVVAVRLPRTPVCSVRRRRSRLLLEAPRAAGAKAASRRCAG